MAINKIEIDVVNAYLQYYHLNAGDINKSDSYKGYNITTFAELDSTSTYLQNNINNVIDHTWVTTDYQTKGRGQGGNTWSSKPYRDITASLLCVFDKSINLNALPLLISLAVYNTYQFFGLTVKIKWPNDIYIHEDNIGNNCKYYAPINDKYCKVAGILVESRKMQHLQKTIIGIGLNNVMEQDRNLVLAHLIYEVDLLITIYVSHGLDLNLWLSKCLHYQKILHILVSNKRYTGVHIGINSNGSLLLGSQHNVVTEFYDAKILYIQKD